MPAFPAARIGDPVTHDMLVPSGVIGPQLPVPCPMCALNPVLIEGMPAAHVGCSCVCTGALSLGMAHPPPVPPTPPPPIVVGSVTVLIHGKPAARWAPSGDMGGCGVFLGDPKLTPTRRVFIGGAVSAPAVPKMPKLPATAPTAAASSAEKTSRPAVAAPRATSLSLIAGAPAAAGSAPAKARVDYPVPGLYESIPNGPTFPEGWRQIVPVIKAHPVYPGAKQFTMTLRGPNGGKGRLQRSYDPVKKELIMEEAFLEDMPSFTPTEVPLVEGRGTPTVTYLTLFQMKKLGAKFGELKSVKMSTIQNVEALMQLHVAAVKAGIDPMDPGQDAQLASLVAKTHSVKYAQTTIEQSGHVIKSVSIGRAKAGKTDLKSLMDHYGWPEGKRADALRRHGMKETDEVLYNYDIHVELAPHPSIART
jgi:uncharacterized Zn-binding protein involved in type VI secretion